MLINPPTGLYRRQERCQSTVGTQTAKVYFPPIDLLQLTAICNLYNVKSLVKDYSLERQNNSKARDDIEKFKPNVLLINSTTPTLKNDLDFLQLAKNINPNIITVAKGGCFLERSEQIISQFSQIDIIIKEEPEDVFEKLVKLHFLPTSDIKGITYRKHDSVFSNPSYLSLPELDRFPLPDRSRIENCKYLNPLDKQPLTVIDAGRGCPHRCIFCLAAPLSNYKIRYRSPENVVSEIESCVRDYRLNTFLLNADTFTFDNNWVLRLCHLIRERNLNITWMCNSRVETVNRILLKEMRQAGCQIIGFGIESGSQYIVDKIDKGFKLKQAEEAVKMCKEVGILSHAFFVIGLPWDNQQTIKATQDFIKKLDPDFFDVNIVYPLPGTCLYNLMKREKLLLSNSDNKDYAHSSGNTLFLSAKKINYLRKKVLLSLFMRPYYILKLIKLRHKLKMSYFRMLTEGIRLVWRIAKA